MVIKQRVSMVGTRVGSEALMSEVVGEGLVVFLTETTLIAGEELGVTVA